ncbi:DUF4010 domain-containing protein [Malikia sp.]|uniref:MgtC/SapB family protein n=1 Tax=Malikia sp. TaxID=2070706 RepID=UPI00260C65DC|nr:DUF4010 domain-containing protein [Malikia sp.]MDD2729581.1 DUF4010 domain-containing protein [Malikia sp.]
MWDSASALLPNGISMAHAAQALAAALGCGLLTGIERERNKGSGSPRALAGLRSFSLACVMGAVSMLTGESALLAVGVVFLAALGVVARARNRSEDPGVTSEIALVLTYLIGVLCVLSLPLAAAVAVGQTGILLARERLHAFANNWLRPAEVRDGILLAALALIALPLMPDRPFWGELLNPHLTTQLLTLLLTIQALAHLSRRLLDARQAVALSAIASGFVSSTATVASMGLAVREGRSNARLMAGAGLLSCVATLLQILLVALAVQPAWLRVLVLPTLAGSVVALLWGWWLVNGAPADGPGPLPAADSAAIAEGPGPVAAPDADRMFSLRGAALVAALLTGVQALVHGLGLWLGQAGELAGVLLASLVDQHAALAAVFTPAPPDSAGKALGAAMLAIVVHAFSKSATAGFTGGWRYFAWLAPGVLGHTAVCVALLAWYL